MMCPQCGAENSNNAQFCTLCAAKLEPLVRESAPGERKRVTVSEWRGEDIQHYRPSKVARKKIVAFRVKLTVASIVVAAVVAWLALSLTVWANPTPSRISSKLIEALNDRDRAGFTSLFQEGERTSAGSMYDELVGELGAEGAYRDVKFRVEKPDNYTAYARLESGSLTLSGGAKVNIQPSDNLVVYLESHGGKWYARTRQTRLVP